MAKHLAFRSRTSSSVYGLPFNVASYTVGNEGLIYQWAARGLTFVDGTIVVPSAPAVGNTVTETIRLNRANTGSTITLTGDGIIVSTRGTFNAAIPIGTTPTTGTTKAFDVLKTASVAAATMTGYTYTCTAPDDDIQLFTCGDGAFNVTSDATPRFYGLGWAKASAPTTEAPTQVAWPVSGRFQYFYLECAAGGAPAQPVTTWEFRINGVAKMTLSITPDTGTNLNSVADFGTTVPVAAGDLVSIRYVRTAGTLSGFSPAFTVGFTKLG